MIDGSNPMLGRMAEMQYTKQEPKPSKLKSIYSFKEIPVKLVVPRVQGFI